MTEFTTERLTEVLANRIARLRIQRRDAAGIGLAEDAAAAGYAEYALRSIAVEDLGLDPEALEVEVQRRFVELALAAEADR